jgi:MFS family permease
MTISLLVMAFSMPFQGRILAEKSVRGCMLFSSTCFVLSFVIFAMAPNVYFFYVGAIPQGLALAIPAYLLVPMVINRWFKKRTGFFIGLCMAFTGLIALIMNPILSAIITAYGWRAGYWTIVVVSAIFMFIPTLLLRNSPEDMNLKPVGYGEASDVSTDKASKTPDVSPVSLKRAMKSPAFYLMCVLAGCTSFTQAINFYWVAYATEIGYGLVLASVIGSVAMLGQMIGKVALGAISDKSLYVSVFIAYGAGFIGLAGTLIGGANIGTATLLVFIFLFGITYATGSVMNPIITQHCFGAGEDYAKIYSNITAVGTFCAAVGSTLYGVIIDFGGYSMAFGVATVLVALCLISCLAALKSSKKLHENTPEPQAAKTA